jgi:hypothetical protein
MTTPFPADRNSGTVVELSPDADAKDGSSREGDRRNEACSSSVSAYNDINRTLGNFYESPQEDPEKEALKAEVEQLKQAVIRPAIHLTRRMKKSVPVIPAMRKVFVWCLIRKSLVMPNY